jgi:hypothetical protein
LAQTKSFSASAIAEFSAIPSSLSLFYALAANPLQNVRRAIPQFDFLVLAIAKETNGLKVDEINLGQIENYERDLILKLLAEFFDAIGADPAD